LIKTQKDFGNEKANSLVRIVPLSKKSTVQGTTVTHQASFAEFMQALDIQPPSSLLSSISRDFFFGYHMTDHQYPVFILPITSYDNAVAGMLAWEGTINADLSPIFTPVSVTTLTGTSSVPEARVFKDTVLYNYDTRVLSDDQGQTVLYYSFPSPKILLIGENPYTFPEVITRLQAQRAL
jgi:hypothetical protein